MGDWAKDFYEIQSVLSTNQELNSRVLDLVDDNPIHGKVTEGGNRKSELRDILESYLKYEITLEESVNQVENRLPRYESRHRNNNRVFPEGWAERLVRTQSSRFYNQAVLTKLLERGDSECFVPHSDNEDLDSPCTLQLAGREIDVELLYNRLERAYVEGDWHDEVMIPDHPHCTHTIIPVSEAE